jgi:hypothetical protein
LASYLLTDGFDTDYDIAVVISNDSDLTEPIRLARARFGVVGVVCPHPVPSRTLGAVASWQIKLFRSYLRRSQFAATLNDQRGSFTKPPSW